jgi:stearoyl-CoA desaturase (delta-9 desaturase)
MGWFFSKEIFATRISSVPHFSKFRELRFLDRYDLVVPAAYVASLYLVGGPQLLVWGFSISTVLLFHVSATLGSLTHRIGHQPFVTGDRSRNSYLLALITFGEWHNTHHRYPLSARQGRRWHELDVTYGVLRLLALTGLIWDLKPLPLAARRVSHGGRPV